MWGRRLVELSCVDDHRSLASQVNKRREAFSSRKILRDNYGPSGKRPATHCLEAQTLRRVAHAITKRTKVRNCYSTLIIYVFVTNIPAISTYRHIQPTAVSQQPGCRKPRSKRLSGSDLDSTCLSRLLVACMCLLQRCSAAHQFLQTENNNASMHPHLQDSGYTLATHATG
jgi:hypothetical protein